MVLDVVVVDVVDVDTIVLLVESLFVETFSFVSIVSTLILAANLVADDDVDVESVVVHIDSNDVL